MSDYEFLCWIHERLELVHKENPLVDYMHRLRSIIYSVGAVDKDHRCPLYTTNSLEDVKKEVADVWAKKEADEKVVTGEYLALARFRISVQEIISRSHAHTGSYDYITAIRTLLHKYGARNLSTLHTEHYPNFSAELETLLSKVRNNEAP